MSSIHRSIQSLRAASGLVLFVLALATAGGSASAATAAGCKVGASFLLQGKYLHFEVDAASFGIRNDTLTGRQNARDITGGVATPVFANKLPDHCGAALTSGVDVALTDEDISLVRVGAQAAMKLQAKDCANGGVFQMEVARTDGSSTPFMHVLATPPTNGNLNAFNFDNRNFRNRDGEDVPSKDTTIVVTPRIYLGYDYSAKFVGRDSPQFATRGSEPSCATTIIRRDGSVLNINHCGLSSRWDVASGGRMGMVFGEAATEVAPPATICTHKCQAQNQVHGQSTVLGLPFPVAPADRLAPRI